KRESVQMITRGHQFQKPMVGAGNRRHCLLPRWRVLGDPLAAEIGVRQAGGPPGGGFPNRNDVGTDTGLYPLSTSPPSSQYLLEFLIGRPWYRVTLFFSVLSPMRLRPAISARLHRILIDERPTTSALLPQQKLPQQAGSPDRQLSQGVLFQVLLQPILLLALQGLRKADPKR